MKSTVLLLLFAVAGVAQAQPYHQMPFPLEGQSIAETRIPFETRSSSGDDTMRCMAIGCAEGDYERYPEYAPVPGDQTSPYPVGYPNLEVIEEETPTRDLTREILEVLDREPAARPAPVPASEDEARASFYQTLRRHADGRGTIEEVEAAYRHLLPYRR